jgi:hypothetical protein
MYNLPILRALQLGVVSLGLPSSTKKRARSPYVLSSKFPYPHISPAFGVGGPLLAAIFEALAETTMELVLKAVVAPFV